jgi:hypothetical protein
MCKLSESNDCSPPLTGLRKRAPLALLPRAAAFPLIANVSANNSNRLIAVCKASERFDCGEQRFAAQKRYICAL